VRHDAETGRRTPSDLFTVRVWAEQVDDAVEWRGKVQHLPSGEAHYFREWAVLVGFMVDVLTRSRPGGLAGGSGQFPGGAG
jgi:hypothetical protein